MICKYISWGNGVYCVDRLINQGYWSCLVLFAFIISNEVESGATLPPHKVLGTSGVQKFEKKDSSTTCDE